MAPSNIGGMGAQVGVNASSVAILEHLVRADTASAFNISVGDVNVTGISQVCKSMFTKIRRTSRMESLFQCNDQHLLDMIRGWVEQKTFSLKPVGWCTAEVPGTILLFDKLEEHPLILSSSKRVPQADIRHFSWQAYWPPVFPS